MPRIKQIQNLFRPLMHMSRWFNHGKTATLHENTHPPKTDGSQKADDTSTDSKFKTQSDGRTKHVSDNQVQLSQTQKTNSEQQQSSNERTRQIMAEASIDEKLPEEQLPDVLLDVPTLKVDEIKLNVDDLNAHVALRADLANLVKIDIGVQVGISKVELDLKGVEAQAILKVRLKQVYAILARALESIDKNPEILQNLINTGEAMRDTAGDIATGLSTKGRQSLDSVAAEGALGVKVQKGQLNKAVGEVSKNADKSIETHSTVSEEERRKMKRVDKN